MLILYSRFTHSHKSPLLRHPISIRGAFNLPRPQYTTVVSLVYLVLHVSFSDQYLLPPLPPRQSIILIAVVTILLVVFYILFVIRFFTAELCYLPCNFILLIMSLQLNQIYVKFGVVRSLYQTICWLDTS